MGITKTLKTIKNGVDNIIDLLGGNIKAIPNDGSMSAIFVYVNSIDPENPSLENASFKVIDVVPFVFVGERPDYNPVMATLSQSDVDALCQLSNYGFGSVLGFVVKSDIPFAKGQIISATQLITEGLPYAIKERLEGSQDYRSSSNSKISGWGGSFDKRLGINLFTYRDLREDGLPIPYKINVLTLDFAQAQEMASYYPQITSMECAIDINPYGGATWLTGIVFTPLREQ